MNLRLICALVVGIVLGAPLVAQAGNTGSIIGTVRDSSSGQPLANVHVTATSPSDSRSAVSDATGFFSLNSLTPDSYTVSFSLSGYDASSNPGVLVQQDQNTRVEQRLSKTLTVIGSVSSRSSSNLLRTSSGTDIYTVGGAQLNAVTGGDNTPKTLYEYLGTIPGVTISGGVGTPRIRGSDVHDIGYEFDGIPIRERMFGLFTTNITSVGIGNVEVYTGGLSSSNAGQGAGVINTVVKTGTTPSFGSLTVAATSPDHNNYVNFEYGAQTPNHRFSYYVAAGTTDSTNDFNYGRNTYQDVLYSGSDGPGPVKERDLVGNIHFKPNVRNDFQFLVQNGLGDFNFNYLLSNPQPKLAWRPCAGSIFDTTGNSYTGLVGGTAPNGGACPVGMFFSEIPGFANVWHHYSGLGKIQWNHIINDKSFFSLRLAENFNQYIFDQPLEDPNNPGLQNPGGTYNIDPTCPTYPYAAGTPVQIFGGSTGNICSQDLATFYGDRSSHMYIGAFDYTNNASEKVTYRLGIGQEYDRNNFSYSLRDFISGSPVNADANNPLWPDVYAYSDVPTHVPYAYANASINAGRFVLEPGLRYSRIYYGAPQSEGGPVSVGLYNPTFSGTYRVDAANAFRFSYGNSSTFIPSAYIYRTYPHGYVNFSGCPGGAGACLVPGPTTNDAYNPAVNGASFAPELIQSTDLMWEHQFNPTTSLRFGPWYNNSRGYYTSYAPLKGFSATGKPIYGKAVKSNNGQHHAFGFELALNHVDPRPHGISYWVSGTYDNYWTSGVSSANAVSPIITPFPSYFVNQGILVRSQDNPLFTGTFTADLHSDRFHFIPEAFYQFDTYYNIGYRQPSSGPPTVLPQAIAPAWWLVNATASLELGPRRNLIAGLRLRNVFDQGYGPAPCFNQQDPRLGKGLGSGCGNNDGPQSGVVAPVGFINQYVTSDPQRVEVFLTTKF